jgi:hypothetical protein
MMGYNGLNTRNKKSQNANEDNHKSLWQGG